MRQYTQEERDRAAEIDLLTYFERYNPAELTLKNGEYRTKTHSSLVIKKTGNWNWYRERIYGRSALDYFIKVEKMPISDAIDLINEHVGNRIYTPKPAEEKTRKPFVLPLANGNNNRVISYLQGRGIDREVIDRCIESGVIYESKQYNNCVFVGRDSEDIPRFACMRGTFGDYKRDIAGSDKRFSFAVPHLPQGGRTLLVFESPIDALSQATISKRKGLKKAWGVYHRLSLSGVAPAALIEYLKNNPEIDLIYLCLDNDKAGLSAAAKIKDELLKMQPYCEHEQQYKVEIAPPPEAKDYNAYLLSLLNRTKKPCRKQTEQVR